jgi:hypothetical protein
MLRSRQSVIDFTNRSASYATDVLRTLGSSIAASWSGR